MKPLLLTLCILNITIISPQLSAMDDDQAIPLKDISQRSISLKREFMAFEKRFSIELSQDTKRIKKEPFLAAYIEKLHKELPPIFTSERMIEKFSRIQNSYFAMAVQELVTHYGSNHYKNVTGDTLATIHKPEISQPCTILTKLPLHLKQYVMRNAYYAIKKNFVRVALGKNSDIFDIHSTIGAAAVIDRNSKTFKIWNLTTGNLIHEIPQASDTSLIRFSTNGSIIITTALFPQDLGKTCITLWNRETKNNMMQLTYSHQIEHIFFDNDFLHVFDKDGSVYIAYIDMQHKKIFKESQTNAGIEKMNPSFTSLGKYSIDNNAILRKSFSYFLCSRAVKNTSGIDSLKKIYNTQFYNSDSLTDNQRKMLRNKIEKKIHNLTEKNKEPNGLMTWFG
jgi:hypothetical protein